MSMPTNASRIEYLEEMVRILMARVLELESRIPPLK